MTLTFIPADRLAAAEFHVRHSCRFERKRNEKSACMALCSGIVVFRQCFRAAICNNTCCYNGVVTTISEGTLYIHGIPHCIATVDTNQGAKRVAVPTMGVMQPLQ